MRNQYEFFINTGNASSTVTPIYFAVAGRNHGSFPSAYAADRVLRELAAREGSPRRYDVVYLNFGAMHLLHMAPWRYWGSRKANSTKVADFDGYFHFEEWIAADIATYRTVSPSVVVMTPNWICDLKYRSFFRDLVTPCLLYTSPSPRDQRGSRMPSSA